MAKGKVYASSKINLGLIIGPKRADGFHDLDSYFLRTALSDEIEYSLEKSDKTAVAIEGNEAYMKEGCVDLMEKAARLFSERTGICFDLKLRIEKHIPSEAGLGGGSSDAASVILLLGQHFGVDDSVLMGIGESTGSDVPFFISGFPAAHVGGRGDVIKEAKCPEKRKLVLIYPDEKVSTKGAFSRLDAIEREERRLPDSLSGKIERDSFPNDFELILDGKMERFLSSIVVPGDYYSLSGSGSTWFILTDNEHYYPEKLKGRCSFFITSIV